MPIVEAPGRQPMRKVAPVIRRIDQARVFVRPKRSPQWPQKKAPTGLIRKATANNPKAISVDCAASPGKNSEPIVTAR